MTNLSINYSQKLRAIRKAENLTQKKFAEITGLSFGTIRRYEANLQEARAGIMEKVLQVPKFRKYTLWLIHDTVAPESGQIKPAVFLNDVKALKRKTNTELLQINVSLS